MIKIDPKYLKAVQEATNTDDLVLMLQKAMKLEHATIPIYLTGMISFKPGANTDINNIIHSVVIEEMLHMSIACNVINALNGSPNVNDPAFIPDFPGPLPLGIGGLTVGLNPFSKDVVKNTFMEIEEPEDPLNFPLKAMLEAVKEEFSTIGQFYHAVQDKIKELVPGKMPGDPAKQMTSIFPPDQIFPILTGTDAVNALEIIIDQGEGTSKSPLDPEGDLAHYYRFAEIYYGKKLMPDKTEPLGYSYSGAVVPFDPSGVYPLYPNTKITDLPADSEAYQAAIMFSQAYSRLLNALYITFNGQPGNIQNTLGMMYDVKLYGDKLAAMPFPGKTGYNVGPVFQFIPVIGNTTST
jgi:hypothetical protein